MSLESGIIYKNNKLLIFLFCIFLLSLLFNYQIVKAENNEVISMTFKNADIKEVFRSIARLVDVNLIVDDSVKGNITLELNKISFNKALSLITRTQNLEYKWDENTIVIATPDRIDQIYNKRKTEVISIKYSNLDKAKNIVEKMYPELVLHNLS